jgi:hypothetical protein
VQHAKNPRHYRREDSAAYTGRLADRLREHFGDDNVFVDIDTIRPGDDYVEKIDQSIAACDVVVVIIGNPGSAQPTHKATVAWTVTTISCGWRS